MRSPEAGTLPGTRWWQDAEVEVPPDRAAEGRLGSRVSFQPPVLRDSPTAKLGAENSPRSAIFKAT